MRRALIALAAACLALPVAAGAVSVFDFSGTGSAGAAASGGSSAVPAGIVEQVSATMLPSVPQPGDLVQIRVTSYSTDLNKAYVTWTKDGSTAAEGQGQVTFSFVAPAAGQKTVVKMSAAKEGGGTVTKTFTVAPATLDLIFEAETYSPPFYQGRAEFTNSSRVRVVALPKFVNPDNGASIPASRLIYTWRIDGTVSQDASGYGRDVLDTAGELVSRGLEIEVEVEAIDSPLRARATLFVPDEQPDIAVYEDHPLYGVLFERAVDADDAYPVNSTEISLLAVPYSMDIFSLADSRAKYTWTTGVGKGPAAAGVTFKPELGTSGLADASVRVNHQNFAQYGSNRVTLNFGAVGGVGTVASTTKNGSYSL